MHVGTRYCAYTTRTPFYEVKIGPNIVWRRHTDQIRDSNVPVTDSHTPVIQPLPFPPPLENHDDQAAELAEQTEVVSRETDCQSSNLAAETLVKARPSQIKLVPVRRYPTRERKLPARLDLFEH